MPSATAHLIYRQGKPISQSSSHATARRLVSLLCVLSALQPHIINAASMDGGVPTAARSAIERIVITGDDLRATGHTQLQPALAVLLAPYQFSAFAALDGSSHVPYGAVRGLTPDHLLVLINGKRRHTAALMDRSDSASRGSVGADLNAIPLGAVSYLDVQLGGNSARHGSNAVAAVIDIVLDDSASGGWLATHYGQSRPQMNDVAEVNEVQLNSDGTLTVFSSGSRNVDDGDGDALDFSGGWGFDLGDGGFMRISADYRTQDDTNRGGYDDRQQFPANPDGTLDVREATVNRLNNQYGRPEVTDLNIVFNAELPVNDRLTAYGFSALGARNAESAAAFVRPVDDNNVLDLYPAGFLPQIESDIDDRSFVIGLRGDFLGWGWDASFNQGESELDWKLRNSLNSSFGALSETRFVTGNNENQMTVLALEVNRTFDLDGYQPLTLLLGLEQRAQEYEIETGDAASNTHGGMSVNGIPQPGGSQGFPGFLTELEVDDAVFGAWANVQWGLGDDIDVEAGVRFDDFDSVGNLFGASVRGRYRFAENWTVHAAASQDYRAPAPAQQAFQATRLVLPDTRSGLFATVSDVGIAINGNHLLEEETATTVSAGFSYIPSSRLELHATLFQTEVDDRIVLGDVLQGPDLQQVLQSAGIDDVLAAQTFFNAADTRTRGIDLRGAYRWLFSAGDLELNLQWSHASTDITGTADVGIQTFDARAEARLEAARPENTWIVSSTWQAERFNVNLRVTLHDSVDDATPFPVAAPVEQTAIDTGVLIDLTAAYAATPTLTFGVGVFNLLNEFSDVRDESTSHGRLYPYPAVGPGGIDGRSLYARVIKRFP